MFLKNLFKKALCAVFNTELQSGAYSEVRENKSLVVFTLNGKQTPSHFKFSINNVRLLENIVDGAFTLKNILLYCNKFCAITISNKLNSA